MGKCLDEGTLQAFLDNELDAAGALAVGRHVAECASCAELLAVVEEETAFVFGALELEMNTLVPTQRLWARISESIAGERPRGWFASFRAWVGAFSMPAAASFASLVVIAGAFALFLSIPAEDAALAIRSRLSVNPIPVLAERPAADIVERTRTDEEFRAVRADLRESPRRAVPGPSGPRARFLDGEATYVNEIAKLERAADANKDAVLSPSARYAYEKDLAVVNDAIRRMRLEVRRNPKSGIARQVLFSSYRNKIELLNSVNERGELMASLGR
jgi:hypothetical protein